MATTTTNLGLSKPAYSDDADVAVINGNMDILDTKIGAVGNTSVQAQINTNSQAITNLNNKATVNAIRKENISLNTLTTPASMLATIAQIRQTGKAVGSQLKLFQWVAEGMGILYM